MIIFALLLAISYAQTGRAQAQGGQQQGGYQQGGYPQNNGPGGYQQGGYPQNGMPQGGMQQGGRPQGGRPQGGSPQWPPRTGTGSTAGGPSQSQAGGMQAGMVPEKTIMDCTVKDQELCPRKRQKALCDADVCCVFEYKDLVPQCYGYEDAPYSQTTCEDYPQQACNEAPGCSWSMTEYECDTTFAVKADILAECASNPSNPECYNKNQEAGMMCGAGILLFFVGCCCGYLLGPKKRA